ncbi:hypothetical protein [Acetobacterium sp.]|uniref:hypothetical protein n=1 Tax=Acetobacterium sp. TaxID=1872094 RepID=UPI002F404D0E
MRKKASSRELPEQVYTLVGLDIGDISPEEVAFSILAEMLMIKMAALANLVRRDRLLQLSQTSVDENYIMCLY